MITRLNNQFDLCLLLKMKINLALTSNILSNVLELYNNDEVFYLSEMC